MKEICEIVSSMKSLLIQISDNYWIKKVVSKRLFMNGEFISAFREDSIMVKQKDVPMKIRLELYKGLFSTEYEIPPQNSSCVLHFENKADIPMRMILVCVALYIILDVLCFQIIPTEGLFILLWGTLAVEMIYIFVKRKKRFKVTVTALG